MRTQRRDTEECFIELRCQFLRSYIVGGRWVKWVGSNDGIALTGKPKYPEKEKCPFNNLRVLQKLGNVLSQYGLLASWGVLGLCPLYRSISFCVRSHDRGGGIIPSVLSHCPFSLSRPLNLHLSLLGSLASRRTWRHLASTVGNSRKQGVQ
jgi:hypothetical protein